LRHVIEDHRKQGTVASAIGKPTPPQKREAHYGKTGKNGDSDNLSAQRSNKGQTSPHPLG
jgi:hypothetical protein